MRVSVRARSCPSPARSHGRRGGQAGGAAVHQRGGGAGQRGHPGLLPHLGVRPVGSHRGDPRPHRPARLHLLLPGLRAPVRAAGAESRAAVEQVLQVAEAAVHGGARGRALHLRPVLDFPVRNGSRVLSGSGANGAAGLLPKVTTH
ncbi:hypothetical protein Nmel_016709 [Mimus melanotis]